VPPGRSQRFELGALAARLGGVRQSDPDTNAMEELFEQVHLGLIGPGAGARTWLRSQSTGARRKRAAMLGARTGERLVVFAAALGAVIVMADVAGAQTMNPPASNPPTTVGPNFVDANGDGMCDNCSGTGQGQGRKARKGKGGYGPADGSGNQGVGPRDGSGYGPGAGSGTCTGTGSKGQGRGRRGGRS
jgi:hypothetical protein